MEEGGGGERRRKGRTTRRMQRARGKGNRNNRGNYLRDRLRAEETGGNEIELRWRGEGRRVGGNAALSSRLFNYLSRSRTLLSFVAQE